MPKPLQYVPEDAKLWSDSKGRSMAIAEVTIRTIMRMFLLKPTTQNTTLILGVLGRAQERYDFEIYSYAFLSNHGSYLIGVRSAEHLSKIKGYIHGNIALELRRQRNCTWDGKFFGRPGRSILVLTDEDVLDRMEYICANSTKEHLVTHPNHWPGAHAARALSSGENDTGLWIDRTETSLRSKKNTSRRRKTPTVSITYTVKLSKVPPLSHLSDEEYAKYMEDMCDRIADAAAKERRLTGKTVLGLKRILRFSPTHTPSAVKDTPAPLMHCCDAEIRRFFRAAYRSFVEGYRIANAALREGLHYFDFPEGGHPPVSCIIQQAG